MAPVPPPPEFGGPRERPPSGQTQRSAWQVQAARDISGPLRQVGTGPLPRPATGPMPRPATGPMPRAATGPQPRAPRRELESDRAEPADRPDPAEPRLPWETDEFAWDDEKPLRGRKARRRSDDALDGQRGEESLRRLRRGPAEEEEPGSFAAGRALGAVLATMRQRNLVTGLVLPMVAAVTVGIAAVILVGANGSGGSAPASGSAGFPPAQNASADFTGPAPRVSAVASSAASEVAAGSAGGEPSAWLSSDGGSTWTRATGLTARAGSELTSVAHGSAGWVAVGGTAGKTAGGPPLVEASMSGTNWGEANSEGAFSGNGLVTAGAAAGPAGYVIVGRQSANGRTIAAAWHSRGLTGWALAGDAGAGDLQGDGDRQMNAVAATARGFEAVGSSGNRPAAWRSADGRTWAETTLPLPSGAARATLGYVAASGASVTAAGTAVTAGQPVPFTEVSVNGGASWTLRMLPLPQTASAATVTALTASGGGFTATGVFGQSVIVWTKASASAPWTEATPNVRGLSGPGTQEITALTTSGTTLTGVGFSPSGPTLWQSPVRN